MGIIKKLKSVFKSNPIEYNIPIKLRFVKTELYFDNYHIEFYNPIKNCWWVIPSKKASIHSEWSLEKKGSYGAYNLYTLQTSSSGVNFWKNHFKTINDIENYFNDMNKEYHDYKKRRQEDSNLPKIIM